MLIFVIIIMCSLFLEGGMFAHQKASARNKEQKVICVDLPKIAPPRPNTPAERPPR